jgi:multiple sugar transport system ATP-binding protein
VVAPGGGLEGQVYAVENHGVEKIVTLKVDEHLVKATLPAQVPIEVDSTVAFGFDSDKLHFFDAETGHRLSAPKPSPS